MNSRSLTSHEQANLDIVRLAGVPTALLFVTATGLRKSILDATLPMRTLLAEDGVHDYACQGQGQEYKVVIPGKFVLDDRIVDAAVSLYRPVTKNGDPRLWPQLLSRYAAPDDVFVAFVSAGALCLLNLTRSTVCEASQRQTTTTAVAFLAALRRETSFVSDELLAQLQCLAKAGPLPSVCRGDTAVGRTVETALGIPINSSRSPDFKGIELKSKRWRRGRVGTRYTLFACVPNWSLSPCKSSAEILERYGYQRDDVRKLYCTVSATKANSQGLQFRVDSDLAQLVEYAWRTQPRKEDVAVWELGRLHASFSAKHRETFWIHAAPVKIGLTDAFLLEEVVHTRGPNLAQFDSFLEEGVITMDHLIKRTARRVSEKGPLFKVTANRLNELFLAPPLRIPLR